MQDLQLFDPLRAALGARGAVSSAALQHTLGLSQPSVSRLLSDAAAHVLTLGQGRATRYALPQAIGGAAADQPVYWINEQGQAHPLARLCFSPGGWVHLQIERKLLHSQGKLPWFMAPLRAEGFIGRALARQLAPQGLPADPGLWSIEQVLLAALHTPDAPGALQLGQGQGQSQGQGQGQVQTTTDMPSLEGLDAARGLDLLDKLADAASSSLPAGSSAGGEQPKFLLRDVDGHPLLAKFSPPRGTPFGERWHDLLQAEHLALSLLAQHGVAVAQTRVVQGQRRTLLLSRRFDRVGRHGRRHVVPLWAVHEAFVPSTAWHWAASCEALEARRRLPPGTAAQVLALQQFGRLIGNSDMHFGNLSLWVQREDLLKGRFALAPLYDMLPMRWRPDPGSGELGLLPLTPEPAELDSSARALAADYWTQIAAGRSFSAGFRALAAEMARRIRG